MTNTETLTTQYQRIAAAAATVSAQHPAVAAYADRAYVDLTTPREIGPGGDEASFKKAFRHANHISAACNQARISTTNQDAQMLGALDAAASQWVTALNHHLAGKDAHAEFTLARVADALAEYDAAVQR